MKECDELIIRIESYEQKLFGEDKALIAKMNEMPTTPEEFAYRVSEMGIENY